MDETTLGALRNAVLNRLTGKPDKPGVEIEHVRVLAAEDELVVEITYHDAQYPRARLGAAWRITDWYLDEAGRLGEFDVEWVAGHVGIYFEEHVWTGGDPRRTPPDESSVHWHRDVLG